MDLYEVQKQIEQDARDAGFSAYMRALEQRGHADTQPGSQLVERMAPVVAAEFVKWRDGVKAGVATKTVVLAYVLDQFREDCLDVAFLVISDVLGEIGSRGLSALTSVASSVGDRIADAIDYETLRTTHPKLYWQLMKKIGTSSHDRYRHVLLRRQGQYAGIKQVRFDRNTKVRLGTTLLELTAAATGLFTVEMRRVRGGRTQYFVELAKEAMDWLREAHERIAACQPEHPPMVVPPRPWTTTKDGGYLTKMPGMSFSKSTNINKATRARRRHAMQDADLSPVFAAVNRVQETPWAVNKRVLEVAEHLWEAGAALAGLPPKDNPEPPPMPDVSVREDDPDLWKRAKLNRALHYSLVKTRLPSKRIQAALTLGEARKYAEFDRVYFVHTLDWRGRIYPSAKYLSPQGSDLPKGLLQFADGLPLGTNGAYWLAVHLANSFGYDKATFDERVAWVSEHEELILASAFDPLDHRWWAEAGSPFVFLAAALEWAGYVVSGRSDSFVSYLPIAFDGSCNGLQNLSAMLRDPVGGAATGLVPGERPSDIYTAVATAANEIARKDAEDGGERAAMGERWAGRITRRLAKRNTMTTPYGATLFGMKEQVHDELMSLRAEAEAKGLPEEDFTLEDAVYVATTNRRAIGKVVVAAQEVMGWLATVAGVIAKDGLPVQWTTPMGLPVVQMYYKKKSSCVDFFLLGRRIKLNLEEESDVIAPQRMASGLSPNLVHSLDAAHLMRTVLLAAENGVRHFAVIHDSYGTHAGNSDALRDYLREAFVEQYRPDVLQDFYEQVVAQLPPELASKVPPPPPRGTLDIEAVLRSEYFFA